MARLTGKVALITGSGSGQGRAAAVLFAREGARVVISDVNVAGGEETVRLVRDAGGEAVFHAADVSKAAQVEAVVHAATRAYGALHELVGVDRWCDTVVRPPDDQRGPAA